MWKERQFMYEVVDSRKQGNLIAGNYVFTDFICKSDGLNVILPRIGKWYTFQLLSGTLLDYHIHIGNIQQCIHARLYSVSTPFRNSCRIFAYFPVCFSYLTFVLFVGKL